MDIFAGGKTTVLVVEDEALLRLVAVGELEDAGMATLEAENGSQALEILGCNRSIDVVFTDIDMPGAINGIELANIVRETYPHMRVIVVSGLSNIENTTLHKAIPFIPNPMTWRALLSRCRRLSGLPDLKTRPNPTSEPHGSLFEDGPLGPTLSAMRRCRYSKTIMAEAGKWFTQSLPKAKSFGCSSPQS